MDKYKKDIITGMISIAASIVTFLVIYSFTTKDAKLEGAATKTELRKVDKDLRRDGDLQFKTINETLGKKLDSDVFNTYVSSEKEANKKRDQQFETIDKRIYDMWTKEGFKE